MANSTAEILAELPCHRCGYDLRAHPQDGKCPECGESVEESRRVGAIPRRPAWRESDPRWRRRMLAGVWILAMLPLMSALQAFGWDSYIRVPAILGFQDKARTLDDTLLCSVGVYVYEPLVFCIGVVLLFAKERGRRSNPLDWTRRWGVLCSYAVLLLSAAHVLFIAAVVLMAIAAVFLAMPPQYQPEVTQSFVDVSTTYLRYGPYPHDIAIVVLAAFSSIAILLACIPLFGALCGSGPKCFAVILLAPLALFALIHIAQAGWYCRYLNIPAANFSPIRVYFCPQMIMEKVVDFPTWMWVTGSSLTTFAVEVAKWCFILAIAVWLSIAQFATWRHGRKVIAQSTKIAPATA